MIIVTVIETTRVGIPVPFCIVCLSSLYMYQVRVLGWGEPSPILFCSLPRCSVFYARGTTRRSWLPFAVLGCSKSRSVAEGKEGGDRG